MAGKAWLQKLIVMAANMRATQAMAAVDCSRR